MLLPFLLSEKQGPQLLSYARRVQTVGEIGKVGDERVGLFVGIILPHGHEIHLLAKQKLGNVRKIGGEGIVGGEGEKQGSVLS